MDNDKSRPLLTQVIRIKDLPLSIVVLLLMTVLLISGFELTYIHHYSGLCQSNI